MDSGLDKKATFSIKMTNGAKGPHLPRPVRGGVPRETEDGDYPGGHKSESLHRGWDDVPVPGLE